MLKFIGIGSEFNTKLGNTSAFIKENDSLIIIDCGGTIFDRLKEAKVLENVKNLYIAITHTHPDHVGSLGDLIFYSYYFLKVKATLIFPNKEFIKKFLDTVGVKEEKYNIKSLDEANEEASIEDSNFGRVNLKFSPVPHVDTIPTYGFIMAIDNKKIYYSGDSKDISNDIIAKLKNGEIDRIYQDTCGLDYEGNNHLSLRKLCTIIPENLRNKVYCMHLDQFLIESEITENGFHIGDYKWQV